MAAIFGTEFNSVQTQPHIEVNGSHEIACVSLSRAQPAQDMNTGESSGTGRIVIGGTKGANLVTIVRNFRIETRNFSTNDGQSTLDGCAGLKGPH